MRLNAIFTSTAAVGLTLIFAAAANAQFQWQSGFNYPGGNGLNGTNATVYALAVYDDRSGSGPALYAGGSFTAAGGAAVNNIAKWNGTQWSDVGGGVNGQVSALTVFDDGSGPALYVGGTFTTAGGAPANSIAKWNGASWAPLGSGVTGAVPQAGEVSAFAVYNGSTGPAPGLYVGGSFTTAGGIATTGIAIWNHGAWSALSGGGLNNGGVASLAVYDGAIYAGGAFSMVGGVAAASIAKWDGTTWSPLGSGLASGGFSGNTAWSLAVFDDRTGLDLYVGGRYLSAGGVTGCCVSRWNGSAWITWPSSMSGFVPGDAVLAMIVFDNGTGPALYAGGIFGSVAQWNGSAWQSVGSVNSGDYALAGFSGSSGPALYAGGMFTNVNGVASNYIAEWAAGGTHPPQLTLTVQPSADPQVQTGGTATFTVTVQDPNQNAVSGAAVTVISDLCPSRSSVTTNSNGQATWTCTTPAGASPGSHPVSLGPAQKTGYANSAVIVRNIVIAPGSLTLSVQPSSNQQVSRGNTATFTLTVHDQNQNSVSGATVAVSSDLCSSPPNVTTNSRGRATWSCTVPNTATIASHAVVFGPATESGYSNSSMVTRHIVVRH